MFREFIARDQTPFTTAEAENFFKIKNIECMNGECSMIATLRALIEPRMEKDEDLSISVGVASRSDPTFHVGGDKALLMEDVAPGFLPEQRERLHLVDIINNDNSAAGKFDFIDHNFEEWFEGWHRLMKITDFFRKSFRVMCFINPDIHSTVLFIDNWDYGRLHYLQCATFAFLPWFLERNKEITEDEMNLINSLRKKTSDDYIRCLNKMAKKYDFRTMSIRNMLEGFETRFERIEIANIKRQIETYIRQVNDLNTAIGNILQSKAEEEVRLFGYQTKIDNNEDSEIMEYFLSNKNLVLKEVTDNYITFGVKTYVEYFDEDMVETVINNKQSYVYRPNGKGCNNIIPEDDMENLMRAIFIDRVLKLRFCAMYKFRLNGIVEAPSHYSYGYEFIDCMPNTHTDKYSCLGNYSRVINECLLKNNYIGALEQCVASCSSLNFGDNTVMEEFMRRIYGISEYDINNRCIELPNGNVVKPKEAIEWLKSQEGQENE